MLLSIFSIAIVAAIAYIWASRGFFSALIHMLCVIIAGAVAFAFWEPLAYLIIGSDSSKDGWMTDLAWGAALGGPFALTLAILRLSLDGLLRKNVDLDSVTNLVGGGICGAVSGVITTGIAIISLSSLRMQSTFMGFEPFTFGNNGSLERTGGLLFPVDRITGGFYATLSDSTFRVENNLAKWHPGVADEGAMLRLNHDDGKSKAAIKPNAFEVLGHYSLAGDKVLNDTFEAGKNRQYTYLNGESATPAQTTIEGYVIRFKPAANEKSGRVIVGNAQLRLIVEKDGESMPIHPIAVISESDNTKPVLGRWLYDGQKVFIATFNGRNESPMAFEFPVPKGAKPIALYVKGNRVLLEKAGDGNPETKGVATFATFKSIEQRDEAIRTGEITPAIATVTVDASTAIKINPSKWINNRPLYVNDALPFNTVLQKDDVGGLELDDSNSIVSGEAKFLNTRIQNRGIDRKLQVRKFAGGEDVVIIQVAVDGKNNRDFGFLSDAAASMDKDGGPMLIDDTGTRFSAYGYVYKSPTETHIRYTPQAPISKVSDMPVMTKSQPEDQLTLIFRVGKSAKLKYFVVGEKAIAEFDKPVDVSKR